MEHRLGQRVVTDVPVRIVGAPGALATGRLCDISVSGGFVRTRLRLPTLSLVEVTLPGRGMTAEARTVAGYVVRRTSNGIGVEWCDFAPQPIALLLLDGFHETGSPAQDEQRSRAIR
jgi:PilZ domain